MKMPSSDPTLAAMRRAGTPLTLENYLDRAYLGTVTLENLDPEIEEQLPAIFRRSALDGDCGEAPKLTDKVQ